MSSNFSITFASLDEVESTQTYARENLHQWDPTALTCVYTDRQTKGRGTRQKTWTSFPLESLTLSLVFTLPHGLPHLHTLAQSALVPLQQLLHRHCHLKTSLKPPNDLFVRSKKLAGALAEVIIRGPHLYAILGVGANINVSDKKLEVIDQPATSVFVETQTLFDLETLRRTYVVLVREQLIQWVQFTPNAC
jgi:BirA family biotin operon repressor/biotin-[acetyl-CoA-carboxylase] ligase